MASGIGGAAGVPFVAVVLFLLLSGSSAAYPARRGTGGGEGAAPNCRGAVSRGECESNHKWCRWCTSDALDDTCFGAAEAWRLPRQVFSCG